MTLCSWIASQASFDGMFRTRACHRMHVHYVLLARLGAQLPAKGGRTRVSGVTLRPARSVDAMPGVGL